MALTLNINGHAYSTWGDVKIKLSMESMAGYFVGSIPNIFKDYTIKDFDVGMGDEFVLDIDGSNLVTGYIEKIIPNAHIEDNGNTSTSIILGGRDKTADLIDCSFAESVNEFKKLSILAIIRKLIAPFNVSLKIEESITSQLETKLETFKVNEGETPFEAITKLCRMIGVLPLSYGDGKLTLTKTTSLYGTTDQIVFGQNAKQVTLYSDNTDRYSKYIVKGQGLSADTKEIKDFASPSGQSFDAVIKRNRPVIHFSEIASDSAGCVNRSKWLRQVKAGNSRKIVYRLFKWSQTDGKVWYPNTLVVINDSFLQIMDTLLITDVEYFSQITNNETEMYVDITVMDKTTYDVNSTTKIWSIFDRG